MAKSPRVPFLTVALLVALVLASGSSRDSTAQSLGLCGVPLERSPEDASPYFITPPGGTATINKGQSGDTCVLKWANGNRYAEAETDRKGRLHLYRFFDEQGQMIVETEGILAAEGGGEDQEDSEDAAGKCATDTRDPESGGVIQPLVWRINTGSLPGYLKDQTNELNVTIQAIRNGRIAWESHIDPCGVPDNSTLNFTYDGVTSQGFSNTGLSVVDYGELTSVGCSASWIACARRWFIGSTAVECDVRLDEDVNWSKLTPPASGHYDIHGVMTHETGHCVRFDHVDDDNQVMRTWINPRSMWWRKLSLGEAEGSNDKY